MFALHTIAMPDGGGPTTQDRLLVAETLNLPYPASANALGTVGTITPGSAYTQPPVITPTGGVLNTNGWPAVLRAVLSSGGIGSVVIEDSGNYSTFPTGFTVTAASGDTTGSGGAVAAGLAAVVGAGIFRQIGPFAEGLAMPYGVYGTGSTDRRQSALPSSSAHSIASTRP